MSATLPLEAYAAADRYAGKADDYSRYRPRYPDAAVRAFLDAAGPVCRTVADIGAGTGAFSRPLLSAGLNVLAVEPNADMRRQAESELGTMPGFKALAGTAEATELADHSVDALVCAQAFHWFDPARVVPEFRRILRPGAPVCLVWNNQRFGCDAFHRDYEAVLRRGCPDYLGFDLNAVSYDAARLAAQCEAREVAEWHFDNMQFLTLAGLQGRVASVSYCPPSGSPRYVALMDELAALFQRHQNDGQVRILYDVEMYCLRLRDA